MRQIITWFSRQLSLLRLPDITPTVILEIVILAFLVYRFLVWIKITRAWTLLKGVISILAMVLIIYLLKMDTLKFIINRGLNIAIITIVVVFQPEIRRVLEQLGEREFISSLLPLESITGGSQENLIDDRTINELVKASVEMGKVKTGALMVIQRRETLEAYERTGITVDAMLTSQLLIKIFEHNTPLHDGAVIIRGNRVSAATCYLPLSDNMELSKELGTRHRAGVGISEVTDSFTIIVSEETGHISTAFRGILTRNVTAEELREDLRSLQEKTTVTKKKFRLRKGKAKNEG